MRTTRRDGAGAAGALPHPSTTKIAITNCCNRVLIPGNTKNFREDARVTSAIDGEWEAGLGGGRGPHASGASLAGPSEPDRDACGVRHQPVRGVRGAYRRPRGEVVHGAGRAG